MADREVIHFLFRAQLILRPLFPRRIPNRASFRTPTIDELTIDSHASCLPLDGPW